jgi:hypothetical protein
VNADREESIMVSGKKSRRRREEGEKLDRAIQAWRGSDPSTESISDDARGSIFNEFRRLHASGERPAPHATLFLPAARWAWGAAVPIFALSLVVGSVLMTQGPYDGGALVSPQPRVDVSKAGEHVVFQIHNGDATHRISKSASRSDGDEGETFTTTTGRFDDRLDSGSKIVYYRID